MLVAKGAALSFIPMGHDVPDEIVIRVGPDLIEALLTAVATLRPARALLYTELQTPAKRGDGSLSCSQVNRFGLERLRASYDPFATILKISAHDRNNAEKNNSDQRG